MRSGTLLSVAFITVAACLPRSAAFAREPTREELQGRIAELQARVSALEAQQQQQQQHSTRATVDTRDGPDATAAEVLVDAERRSRPSAVLEGTAGRDEDGFFIQSADKNFLLRPVVLFQFRGVANTRSPSAAAGGGRDWESGFELRRVELSAEGHAFTPRLTYEFLVTAERDGGGLALEDALFAYQFADAWGVAAGQFKDPLFHEQQSSSKYILAVDRSLLNELIAAPTEFVQGVALVYGNDDTPLHGALAVHDGAGSINTPFTDFPGGLGDAAGDQEFGVTGRVEYRLSGDWDDYEDFTAKGTESDLLVLGAAAEWTRAKQIHALFATADAQWEAASGWSAYGAVLARYTAARDASVDGGGDALDWGALVQAAYLVSPSWEVFGRYAVTVLDQDGPVGDGGGRDGTFHEATAGVNYYLGTGGGLVHRAKLTFDVSCLPDGAPSDQDGIGVLEAEDDEVVVRGQFQLLL